MNMIVVVLALFAAAFAGGFLWAFMGWQRTRGELAAAEARVEAVEDSRVTMAELLKAQAAQSAQVVADQMVSRATETFRAQDQLARERMAAQLKPVSDTLTRFQDHVAALEKSDSEEAGGMR
ncbi:MAG TPA: DNA recombination protein RmuC, partial [Brevundimonas sp.]|nr:DNA recombination protein RmuC [Brevundimonas sp.]